VATGSLHDTPRRPARDLIEAVVENMRSNLEPLKYSTLVPSRYVVYLHPREFARVEEIIPVLREQTARALDEALQKENAGSLARRVLRGVLPAPPPIENPARGWQIDFMADPDGEVAEGDILVQSDLVVGDREEPGVGQRTRRVSTMRVGGRTTSQAQTSAAPAAAAAAPLAKLTFEDDSGPHTYHMERDAITIGRGGATRRVDVRIDSSADVSREHLAIRRDPSGRFFVSDLSMLGTTVNGIRVPKGYDEAEGTRVSNGVEAPLPDRSRIGLAETVFIDFEILRG
jgi:hypothetical protein